MKIIHEINQLEYGGVERVVRNLIKFDTENEHSIITYKDGPFREEFEKLGVKISIVDKENDCEGEVDIFHIHTGGDNSKLAQCISGSFPLIETIHSPVRTLVGSTRTRVKIGVTDTVTKLNHNCITIHNGVDFGDLIPKRSREEVKKELGINDDALVIGRLGRIGRDKCLEEWLLTCWKLQQRGLAFHPLIIGDEALYSKGYISQLKLMCASLPVNGVIWAGMKKNVSDYYQIMDIFLYPSPTEGFGLVYIEALYNGCKVVTYKNEVTEELIKDYAILCDESIDSLCEGVMRANITKGRDYRQTLVDNFSASKMAKKYQELYRKVLNGDSFGFEQHSNSKTVYIQTI